MEEGSNKLSIPVAIIVAGIFIAGAIVVSGGLSSREEDQIEPTEEADINIKAITDSDHIRGLSSAPVKVIEFSDTECPFCKMFHGTMKQAMDEYGKDGRIAWVYRHFPIDSLHSKARKEAEALECAGELGGNEGFWKYVDRVMEITPSNNQLEPEKLFEIADYVGLERLKFTVCLDSGKHASKVQADVDDGVSAGARGTPYSVIIARKDGKKFPVDGAMSYESLKNLIDVALEEK